MLNQENYTQVPFDTTYYYQCGQMLPCGICRLTNGQCPKKWTISYQDDNTTCGGFVFDGTNLKCSDSNNGQIDSNS